LIKRVLLEEEASENRVRAVAVHIYEEPCRRIRDGTRSLETPSPSFTEMYLPAEKEACCVGRADATEIPLDIYLLLRAARLIAMTVSTADTTGNALMDEMRAITMR
jgi:hypothetical protein